MADIEACTVTENQSFNNEVNTVVQNGENADYIKYTFEDGLLSVLGTDVEVLPRQLIQDHCNVTSQIDLSFNKLKSLDGLEHFRFIKELVLDNNELHDGITFPHLSDLHTLTLNKNKFTDLHSLLEQLVKKFPNLTYLSLLGNEACPNELSSSDKDDEDYQRYRYYVLYKLPGLKFLDSTPVTAAEVAEAKRIGPYTLVVKPKENGVEEQTDDDSPDGLPVDRYTPLPAHEHSRHQGKSYWTKNKSKYVGRNSEGNRFITDLVL